MLLRLFLLWVLVACSPATPNTKNSYRQEFAWTDGASCNDVASQVKVLEQKQLEVTDGVMTLLSRVDNLTDVVSTRLTIDDRCIEGVEERVEATCRLLDDLRQQQDVNTAHHAESQQLKEANARLKTEILLAEEESRKSKADMRLAEEENRVLKAEIRQVEEEARLVKRRNQELELAETHAQEQKTMAAKLAELESENQLLQHLNNNTQGHIELVEDKLSILESEKRDVEDKLSILESEKRDVENKLSLTEEEVRILKTEKAVSDEENEERIRRTVEEKTLVEYQLEEKILNLQMLNQTLEEKNEIIRKEVEENKHLEERLFHMEGEVTSLRAAQQQTKEGIKQQILNIEGEKNTIVERNRLMEEELNNCKKNVSELYFRSRPARDCAELYCGGVRQDGVYLINHGREGRLVTAWCDMTSAGGGWTVFLQRNKGSPTWVEFARDWQGYKHGFGSASTEYWLGNEALHQLTQHTPQTLRVAAGNIRNERNWAAWSSFSVADENTGYQLLVDGYQESSTLGDFLVKHINFSGTKFSTYDRDNDNWPDGSCVGSYGMRGGWWFKYCSYVFPTVPHAKVMTRYWTPNVNREVRLNELRMMIRPRNFPTCPV
nr:angiopoietin-1-like isoform X2 [Procambarus clarkii]